MVLYYLENQNLDLDPGPYPALDPFHPTAAAAAENVHARPVTTQPPLPPVVVEKVLRNIIAVEMIPCRLLCTKEDIGLALGLEIDEIVRARR